MQKIIAMIMTVIMYLFPTLNIPEVEVKTEDFGTSYTCVFVHGLSGWGQYDLQYAVAPYWGMLGGDLMKYLNARGFDCHAASVGGSESAWDRACELYAQLTGTVTDYGKEHSERCHHERYGEDFTGKALIDSFSRTDKINLFGHSFGGATILTFLELMANGSAAEQSVTPSGEISGLFTGGKGDWIYSVTTLAAPLNGTTAYEAGLQEGEERTFFEDLEGRIIELGSSQTDERIAEDYADYDMHIDNALKMLEGFETLESVYYFSIPCSSCTQDENGDWQLDTSITEPLFIASGKRMTYSTYTTPGGYVVDEKWFENDGLVNTYSARAPFNAPQTDLDKENIQPGIWNVFPTYCGDHMSLQGGMTVTNNVRELYVDVISMINGLN